MSKMSPLCALVAAVLALAPAAVAQSNPDSDYDGAVVAAQPMAGGGARFTWTPLASNVTPRSRPGGDWVGTKFYLIGGESTGGTRGDFVEIFNAVTLTWSTSANPMPIPVSNIMGSTAAVGSKIYVFGGYDIAAARRAEVQIYDTATDTWSVGPTPLPGGALLGCLAEAIGPTTIFVTGGSKTAGNTSESWRYDTAAATFTADAAIPTARAYIAGAYNSTSKRVYAAGGYGFGTTFDYYDTVSGAWTMGPPIPNDRAGCGLATVGNYVAAIAGNWTGYLTTTDLYNAATNTWAPGAPTIPDMAYGRRTYAYGLYKGPGGPAVMAADGWRGYYMVECEALH